MRFSPGLFAILFFLGCVCAGCHILRQPTADFVQSDQSFGQLVFHSDFVLPRSHRLIRELVDEREYISKHLQVPFSDEPIHIHLFRDCETYDDYKTARFPEMPSRRAFFVESDTRLIVYAHWGDHVAIDLRHEVAHGYLHASIGNLPLWLDEGLAEYFEVARGQKGLNRSHLDLLLAELESDDWQPDLRRLSALEDFASLTQKDYAESWAWAHYLLKSGEAERDLFYSYLSTLREEGVAEPIFRQLAKLHHQPEENLVEHLREL